MASCVSSITAIVARVQQQLLYSPSSSSISSSGDSESLSMTRFARLAAEETAAGIVAVGVDCSEHEANASVTCVLSVLSWLAGTNLPGGGCFRARAWWMSAVCRACECTVPPLAASVFFVVHRLRCVRWICCLYGGTTASYRSGSFQSSCFHKPTLSFLTSPPTPKDTPAHHGHVPVQRRRAGYPRQGHRG